ncbi:C1-like protein [Thalictrum thalictroides]|uniref:C1-like protein n=1 Tax=Thalictrum thalictroides TaxID=46969 RepID=A0A7J6V8W6_THATH|nr:C1-like protein [Thalictrum thalictroides]
MKYGEITHFSHPQHKLKFEYLEAPFKCDGCKEVGIGSRYKCNYCDYDLHMHCAIPSPTINHPFYHKCSFQFLSKPPGNIPRFCNACEKDVSGFVYHCKLCGFDLHPCCAKLPYVLDDGEIKLFLYRKVSSACHRCGRKGRSWSYRSTCKKYNLHVACVKEMLVESWHELYFGPRYGGGNNTTKTKKLETRIPSLKGTLQNHHRSKSKVKKCCEMAGLAIQFIISAVLGDPSTLIAGVVGTLMSK